jgi:hypothetical protein
LTNGRHRRILRDPRDARAEFAGGINAAGEV